MDYKEKYEQGLECIQEILESGEEKIKMTLLKQRLLPFFPELESEDEKMRRKCINFLNLHKRFHSSSAEIDDCIAWLKKQKATDKEIIFRALPGTDIIAAAKQALEKIEIGKEVILSFNDIYIPVNGKTVAEICNEYFSWTEKQGEKKVPSVDFKAKDCYVSKVDGNIHDMTYDAVDKVEPKNMEDETEIPFDANDSELTEVTYYIPKGFHAEIDDDKVVIKIGENKPIMNVPTREVILAIWDLGNEWKELTNGSISTKYGTTLDYIQKHWNESEYYLREKQDEQNKNNSENYCEDCINRKGCINCENGDMKETEHKVEPKFKVGDIIINIHYRWDGKHRIREITDGKYIFDSGSYIDIKEQNSWELADKVEPKFSEGDWITCKELNTAKIIKVNDDRYEVEFIDGSKGFPHIDYIDRNFHFWTIDDAKDGDILVDDLCNICIYQEPSTKLMYHSYCYGKHKYFIDMGGSHEIVGTCPATKEQRNLLFQKMKEAGYQWDVDKKELKFLISNGSDFESDDSEQESKEEIKSAQEIIDDWHKRQGTSVKETIAYGTFGKYGIFEYVYILDYCSGRVIVAKHDVNESIEDFFKQLGLKESQCHYMVSSDVLSIEYINF